MVKFKHSFMAVSSNFDLEPIIEDYLNKYPEGQYDKCEIVFRTRDEHWEGSYSYMIVFTLPEPRRSNQISLFDYLKTYIGYQNAVEGKYLMVSVNPLNHIFPQIGHRTIGNNRILGRLPED